MKRKPHTQKLQTWKHDCNSSTDLVSKLAEQVCMYVTILKTVKLPALPLLLSIVLMPAENHTNEKANQNSSEVALYIHRQKAA